MPESVLGATRDDADEAITAAGLRVGTVSNEFSTTPAGRVVRTDPAPGESLRPDAVVSLVISRGVEQVPVVDVQGRPRDQAEAALRAAGFRTDVEQVFSDSVAAGTVVDAVAVPAAPPGAGRRSRSP